MPTRPDFDRAAASRSPVFLAALGAALLIASGCAFSGRVETPRSSWDQILATTAIDRALDQLDWPEFDGQSIYLEIGPPGDVLDERYLEHRIEVTLRDRGAQIARSPETAKYVLTCLVGAIGLDINGRMFGIEGSPGGLIPFTIPELALFKNILRRGFAKTEIHLVDRETNRIIHRSGPVEGSAYRRSRTYFFVFETRQSDTTRLE